MAEYKCSICDFQFESADMPEECASCKRNNRKKPPKFEEIEQRVAPRDRTGEEPKYHWRCETDGFKFDSPAVPLECPVCVRHGRISKKLMALTPEASIAAAEVAGDDDVVPMQPPSEKSTKAEIIEALKQLGCKTIKVGGVPVPLDDCASKMPPNKESLLALYDKTVGESAPEEPDTN